MSDRAHFVSVVDRILDVVSEETGVRISDDWTSSDQYIFRGPHGRLESISPSDDLGHWKRGPYCIEATLRDRLEKAIEGHSQWSGWRYVGRNQVGNLEPVIVVVAVTGETSDGMPVFGPMPEGTYTLTGDLDLTLTHEELNNGLLVEPRAYEFAISGDAIGTVQLQVDLSDCVATP